ncbi:tRNA 5-hydroxyuridine modification protein YegQ [Thiorhodococcus mannitoliphagus]|uniref:tRNA 5-hydroxyuridine modification protein YegQ n=2 Tax=Thiorhodococcus mannitoliphagus TaxID=329406 RepID=A0A6P1DXD4_9GAMM|nr:tRNA 5-hydroxyuridine modification protein YegQ [Thiorhodococcus mannitoliphagus]NEX20782.1 tRNA 5-hydroxyuridine modification protein YegQ [Thiorhodococcus mannitoliphagus]
MPELLSPAGTLKNMRYALAYGADAVYAGLPRYSLRVRNNDFDLKNLETGLQEVHAQGKRFYLTANLMPHGAKLRTFIADLEPIVALGPDALIMADPGLIMLVRERWPDLPIHLSVQANTVNAAAVRFWQTQGLSRVILSRELSLDEIAAIRDACPDIELEVFVHGALCIAYSGRCLLSGYFSHRDANQGACTNACRWEYKLTAESGAEPVGIEGERAQVRSGRERHPAADDSYLLEESNRPGEYMPILEDENGTYIMNSRDLQAVEHVSRLVEIGIDCLKIEGRTKSHYYAARTAQVYRAAIDDAVAGRPFRAELKVDLEGLANRGYTEGFYRRHAPAELQNYEEGVSRNQRRIFVGEVVFGADGWAEVEVKNRFAVGDQLELMSPEGNRHFQLEAMVTLEGEPLSVAPGAGWQVRIRAPQLGNRMSLLTRAL